jgi:hypothetical protein
MASKAMKIEIMPEDIKGVEIMKSGDYRYARVGVKRGDDEYLSITYEWKGGDIPEFVMGLMDFMKANEEEIEKAKDDEEFASLKERI